MNHFSTPETFDMAKKPKKQKLYTSIIGWIVCFPAMALCRLKINKKGMSGLKPPYLVLSTHHSFLDYMVAIVALAPYKYHFVADPEAFLKKEWILRDNGVIVTRKFINDVRLIKHINYVVKQLKGIPVIYPEARFSLAGTNSAFPDSIYKLVRLLKVPVVVLNIHGSFLSMPVWQQIPPRMNRLEADMTQIITASEASSLPLSEIKKRIDEAFEYDEYKWQKQNHIKVWYKRRAEGLHFTLYQCPNCKTEYHMGSRGTQLFCSSCNKRWKLTSLGEIKALSGKTEFSHVPDWFDWQRENVKKEIVKGKYNLSVDVNVETYPNSGGYKYIGMGKLYHSIDGFKLVFDDNGTTKTVTRSANEMYSVPTKYNFFHYKPGISLSFMDISYYCYPTTEEFSPTKVAFATEEIYALSKNSL